jgi:TatD DNase family protein
MRLIDTHCHLAHGKLRSGASEHIRAAREAGVAGIVIAAGDLHEARTALHLADEDGLWCMAGIHPHEARDAKEHYLDPLAALLAKPKCVAMGEIGLDYHYDFSPREVQRSVFAAQLELAKKLDSTVVVHTREAFDDTLALLRESGAKPEKVIFHSYSGGPAEARRALDVGAAMSFSGIATFAKADDVREAALLCPADRILVETDAPYLSPEPVRKLKPNTPANVVHVARCLAELRGVSADEFAERTTANAVRLFGLDNRFGGAVS